MASESRQNLVAGLFVLVGVVLACATLVVIQQLTLTPRSRYQVRFTVAEGVGGLASGSDVRVGGLARGSVTAVTPEFATNGRLDSLTVTIEVDDTIEIFEDAKVLRMTPLLGNTGFLNFVSLGGEKPRLAAGGEIAATPSPGMLATIVGGENADQIGTVISNLESASELLGTQVPRDYDEYVRPTLADIRTVAGDVANRWPNWSGDVTETLDNAVKASVNLIAGIDDARALIAEARKPVGEIADLVEANAPKVEEIVTAALDVSDRAGTLLKSLNEEAMPKLLSVLEGAQSGIDQLNSLIGRLSPEILAQLPQVRAMLTDLRESSSEVKLAMIEIRRNPWRLLYQPTTELIAHENLYDAARNFTLATADLKVASESLEEILAADPQAFDQDPELLRSLQQNLGDQLRRYEDAQRDLFRIILAKPSP